MDKTPFSLVTGLVCLTCERRYPFQLMLEGCPDCRAAGRIAILDPVYAEDARVAAALSRAQPRSLWGYHPLLPVPNAANVVSLGEGGSPLLPLDPSGDERRPGEWKVKYEAVNPTHSYKDRTNAVAVSAARAFGCDKVVCTSTGNHAVALASYAARANLRCLILLPPEAPPLSVKEMRFFGAEVVTIADGNIVPLIAELVANHGWYVSQRNAPGVGGRPFGNPYGMEGYKTIAYEVFHQLGGRAPDKVFLPVGGGDAAWGVYKGFRELRDSGLANRIPQIIACQSTAGAPLEHALRNGLQAVAPVDTSSTIAYSIVERQTGDHALWAIQRSGGRAVGVDDTALRRAERTFAAAGICVEPSSAASLAAASLMAEQGEIAEDETVVLIATGAGLRWPATFADNASPIPAVEGTLQALERHVRL
ncbi:MAG: threonine synthase [Thermomicrobiales bacterium]|nr:threonine synthase [Thermomicrobiales bacterium]